ncbi:MAG TPA: hypothetical protein VEB43_17195 [Anaeromyxobacter sp.]|nr:hypothetical protein [Anaeromyxobacter sp.]
MRKRLPQLAAVVLLIAGGVTVALVRARTPAPEPLPTVAEQIALVQGTIHELGVARNSGDFTQFWAKAAVRWQRQTTPSELHKTFGGPPLEGDLTALDPVAPTIEGARMLDESLLMIPARYDLGEGQLYVRGRFVREGGAWKLMGLHLGPTPMD